MKNDSLTRWIGESGSQWLSDSASWGLTTHRRGKFSFKHSKADYPTSRVGELLTPWVAKSENRWLPDSPSRRVGDSMTCQVGELFFDCEYLREFKAVLEFNGSINLLLLFFYFLTVRYIYCCENSKMQCFIIFRGLKFCKTIASINVGLYYLPNLAVP